MRLVNTLSSLGCSVWQNRNVCTLLWQYAIFTYVQSMGKVHLIYEKGLINKLFTYGCHDTARGQRMRVDN